MKKLREGDLKPYGWSYYWGSGGGKVTWLYETFRTADLHEWFFRVPFTQLVIGVCRVRSR